MLEKKEEKAINDLDNILGMLDSESVIDAGSNQQSMVNEEVDASTNAAQANSGHKINPDEHIRELNQINL